MPRNNNHRYSGISSSEDFRREKEILLLRSKIIDTRLSLAFLQIKQGLSLSNMIYSLVRKYFLPEVTEFPKDSQRKT
jgi:hypothetical protein